MDTGCLCKKTIRISITNLFPQLKVILLRSHWERAAGQGLGGMVRLSTALPPWPKPNAEGDCSLVSTEDLLDFSPGPV